MEPHSGKEPAGKSNDGFLRKITLVFSCRLVIVLLNKPLLEP